MKVNLKETLAWKKLTAYFLQIKDKRITDYFEDEERMQKFSFDFNGIYFDFSKHRWNQSLLNHFVDLADEMDLADAIQQMFAGNKINITENRAVLHTALRQMNDEPVMVDGTDVIPLIRDAQKRIKSFAGQIISGQWKGVTGKSITDVVNIGIGGSDLGPKMMVEALSSYKNHLNIHFLSNVDPFQLDEILQKIDLETTLFIIVSKSFSTQETLTNAKNIQQLYIDKYGKSSVQNHFATVSTQINAAQSFGIHPDNVFPMWDWVGGRFSLWSPAGISIALALGYDNFEKILQGAHRMDLHFKNASFDQNLPVLLAFLTLLYNNLYGFQTETYIPYAEKLKYLPAYLQQLFMESTGKSVNLNNEPVTWQTGNIVWGNTGTNAQHSFFQLLHQGTKIVPVHFMAEKNNTTTEFKQNHRILLAHMLAQSEALMTGEKNAIPYKNFKGNRPSSVILLDEINPESIGSLVALYEHKVFTEAWLWQINAFDQFGVELGKKLAGKILEELHMSGEDHHDVSTRELIKRIQ